MDGMGIFQEQNKKVWTPISPQILPIPALLPATNHTYTTHPLMMQCVWKLKTSGLRTKLVPNAPHKTKNSVSSPATHQLYIELVINFHWNICFTKVWIMVQMKRKWQIHVGNDWSFLVGDPELKPSPGILREICFTQNVSQKWHCRPQKVG